MKDWHRGWYRTIALSLMVLAGCGQASVPASPPHEAAETKGVPFRRLTPPENWERFRTQAFNLLSTTPSIVTGRTLYDANFDMALDRLLSRETVRDPSLRARLMTGPATEATFWHLGSKRGALYTLCQAHECSTTSLVMFYQPDSHAMTARLQVKCVVSWLGDVSDAERALISREYPIDLTDVNREHDCVQ